MFDLKRAEREALNNVKTMISIRCLELRNELEDEFSALQKKIDSEAERIWSYLDTE